MDVNWKPPNISAGDSAAVQPSMAATEGKFEVQVSVNRMCTVKVRPRIVLARIGDVQ